MPIEPLYLMVPRETLANVFGRFTEGFETANLTEARALLAQLS